MKVRLLGPVQVRREVGWVDAGSPRQCAVLASLALAAGGPVPVETLLDRVWGDHLPGRARDSLYVYLARLQRLLATGSGPVQPVRRPGGYALEVAADQVDALRFRALVEQSRTGGLADPERLRRLDAALALWRGEPLSRVPGQWAALVRQSWSQQRLDAMVEWARCHLARGTPQAAISTLRDLTAEHPLAEQLAAVLMRALAATGQGSAALDHYAALQRRLAEELGADPGAELRQLHREILRGNPATTPPLAAPEPPRPAQLPPDRQGFSGRVAELAQLDAQRRRPEAHRAGDLDGFRRRRVGKTALAIHWSHRVADRFPDGQLYLNLRGFHPQRAAGRPHRGTRAAAGRARRRAPGHPGQPGSGATAACCPANGHRPEARQAWQEAEQILADLGIGPNGTDPGPLIP